MLNPLRRHRRPAGSSPYPDTYRPRYAPPVDGPFRDRRIHLTSAGERVVYIQPCFGDPGPRAIPVRRTDRHRIVSVGRAGSRWLVVRAWYGRTRYRVPVVGYW